MHRSTVFRCGRRPADGHRVGHAACDSRPCPPAAGSPPGSFAAFLRITPEQLRALAVPGMTNVATVAGGCRSVEEDEVRRRELLTGVVAAGATAVVGARPAAAAEPVDLEVALLRLPQAEPMPLPRLVGLISAARRDYCATQYTRLGQTLPGLIAAATATRDASTGRAREEADLALARSCRGRAGDEAALRCGLGGRRPCAGGCALQRHPGGRRRGLAAAGDRHAPLGPLHCRGAPRRPRT